MRACLVLSYSNQRSFNFHVFESFLIYMMFVTLSPVCHARVCACFRSAVNVLACVELNTVLHIFSALVKSSKVTSVLTSTTVLVFSLYCLLVSGLHYFTLQLLLKPYASGCDL